MGIIRLRKLGDKQLVILEMISRLGTDAYGAGICRALEESDQSTALPQIYAALDKLEKMKLVASTMSEPSEVRGGRRKRVFRITGQGQQVLQEARQDVAGNWGGQFV